MPLRKIVNTTERELRRNFEKLRKPQEKRTYAVAEKALNVKRNKKLLKQRDNRFRQQPTQTETITEPQEKRQRELP